MTERSILDFSWPGIDVRRVAVDLRQERIFFQSEQCGTESRWIKLFSLKGSTQSLRSHQTYSIGTVPSRALTGTASRSERNGSGHHVVLLMRRSLGTRSVVSSRTTSLSLPRRLSSNWRAGSKLKGNTTSVGGVVVFVVVVPGRLGSATNGHRRKRSQLVGGSFGQWSAGSRHSRGSQGRELEAGSFVATTVASPCRTRHHHGIGVIVIASAQDRFSGGGQVGRQRRHECLILHGRV